MGLADVDIGKPAKGARRCSVGKLLADPAAYGLTEADGEWFDIELSRERGLNRDGSCIPFADLAVMIAAYTEERGQRHVFSISAVRTHAAKRCACHL